MFSFRLYTCLSNGTIYPRNCMATQIRSQIFEVLPSSPTLKVLFSSYVGAVWLSLIWAVMPNLTGGLFAIMAVIGAGSITMLLIGLELGCELTRNSNASSAVLWFSYVYFLSR